MHRLFVFAVVVSLCGGFAYPQQEVQPSLETRLLLDGLVEMLVPTAFQPMPEEILKLKYPMERRPTLVLSNDSGSVSLALNHTRDRIPGNDLAEAHRVFDGMFRKLYPSAEWFRSGLESLNGRQFVVIELRTPAIDTEIRNLMTATVADERLLLISFNVTLELEGEWVELADRMIRSIVVKK